MVGICWEDRTYFSATKWDWLKENVEEVKEARKRGTLMAGTVDTWLVYVRSTLPSPPSSLRFRANEFARSNSRAEKTAESTSPTPPTPAARSSSTYTNNPGAPNSANSSTSRPKLFPRWLVTRRCMGCLERDICLRECRLRD